MGGDQSDIGLDIAVTGDHVYITGYYQGTALFGSVSGTDVNLISDGGLDIFVAKYKIIDGSLVWARSAGSSSDDQGNSIAVDATDNVYTTGSYEGNISFSGTALTHSGGKDGFIAKYNSSGTIVWAEKIGTSKVEDMNEVVVDATSPANVYVTGYFEKDGLPGGAGGFDILVRKYAQNAAGTVPINSWSTSMGGTNEDRGNSLGVDASGNVYATGFFSGDDATFGTTEFDSFGELDIFLTQLNSSGVIQWAKQMGGTAKDEAYSIAVESDGYSCVTGYFHGTADFDPSTSTSLLTSDNNEDTFIALYNASGVLQHVSQLAGSANIRGHDVVSAKIGNEDIAVLQVILIIQQILIQLPQKIGRICPMLVI